MSKASMSKAAFGKVAKSPATALAFVRDTGKVYRDAQAVGRSATVQAVYATGAAIETGVLFGDRSAPVDGAMTTEQFADLFGVGKSNVTAWRDLFTYVSLGGNVDGERFGHLLRGGITNPAVRDAVRAPGATVASVETAFLTQYGPDGKRLKAGDAKARRGGRPASESDGGGESTGSGEADHLAECQAAIKTLGQHAGSLTTEQWSQVETALDTLRTKENTLRVAAAAKAAKAARKPQTRPSGKSRTRRTRKAA